MRPYIFGLIFAVAVHAQPTGNRIWFDVQGHRGSRGEGFENTIPAFAWALLDGVTTIELDNGLTKDGVVIVWHDEVITPEKCRDTYPAFKGDPLFPYVGKKIANLTLSQIKTLNCGSDRLANFPLQLTYPNTKISTLLQVFQFAACADPERRVRWNIESKINSVLPGNTRGVEDFVKGQHAGFIRSGYPLSQITYQSFDWRTLIRMKTLDPRVPTAALADRSTTSSIAGKYPWLGGVDLDGFPGANFSTRLAQAAKSIKADVLSPNAGDLGSMFTDKEMVDQAHALGLGVIPWTVNHLGVAELLLDWGVDGIISDYPIQLRRLAQQRRLPLVPRFLDSKVLECLKRHTTL